MRKALSCLLALLTAGWTVGAAQAQELAKFTLIHDAPVSVAAGEPLTLRLKLYGFENAGYVALHHRPSGPADGRYRLSYFEATDPNAGLYVARLEAGKLPPEGIEYYISVVDSNGDLHPLFSSADRPHRVTVSPADAPAAVTGKIGTFSRLREEFELFEAESAGDVVVTASRRAQKIETSPSAVSVITADQIRESGVTSIAEAIRLAAGVHVITINQTNHNVSIRGFNGQNPNKILTYIDGRSVYLDPLGMTFFEAMPIHINDIQRIEVVRGPVSALYGANAINGLINIITKTPEQSDKARVELEMGELSYSSAYASLAHQGEKLGGRLSVNLLNHNNWDNVPDGPFFEDRFRTTFDEERWTDEVGYRGFGRLLYKLDKDSNLSLSAGAVKGNLQIDSALGDIKAEGLVSHVQADADIGRLHARVYYNRVDLDAEIDNYFVDIEDPVVQNILYGPLELKDAYGSALDGELTYNFEIGERINWLAGAGYRIIELHSDRLDDPDLKENWSSVFTQLEWQAADSLLLNLAARLDHHPISGNNILPRAAAVYSLNESHHLRASVGRAFRNPTMLESSFDFTLVKLGEGETETRIGQVGNRELEAEIATSFELGYGAKLGSHFRLNLDGFYTLYTQAMPGGEQKSVLGLVSLGGPLAPANDPNGSELVASGAELTGEWNPNATFSLTGNYSYVDVEVRKENFACDQDLSGGRCDPENYNPEWDPVIDKGAKRQETPNHLMNLKATLKPGDFTLSGWVYAASNARFRTTNSTFGRYSVARGEMGMDAAEATRYAYKKERLEGFWTLNLMAAYRISESPELELGLVGQNLAGETRREYPSYRVLLTGLTGVPTGREKASGGTEMGRLVYGYLSLKW